MKNFSFIQLFVPLFIGQIVMAGGWSSGGGGLLKDKVNPWFLNNTHQVSYCILIDQKNFGVNLDVVKLQLSRAIEFWKEQFSHAILPKLSTFGQLQIASQTFTETSCHNDTDIVFQFGVLTQEQKKFLKDPTEYAAISVRTDYDKVNLRGKGFVYISPNSGALAYNSEGVIKSAWSVHDGQLLYLTLLHELGHVFGLQHMGSYGDLMSEGFVESILASENLKMPIVEKFNFFSLSKGGRLICPSTALLNKWQNYFGAQTSDKCFQFEFSHDSKNELFGKTLMKVFVAKSALETLKKIQEIELSMDRFFPSFTSLIWLSKNQAVFDNNDLQAGINSGILGIGGLNVGKQGYFTLSNNKNKKSISVRFEQGRRTILIDGVIDGKIVPLL